jgi:hypothetical protein
MPNCFAEGNSLFVARVMEAMGSHLDRSIVFDRVDLQGPGHKFADHRRKYCV